MRRPIPVRVLVVTEDRGLSEDLCDGLAGRGYAAMPARSVEEGLEQAEQVDHEVALVDLELPGGVELIRRLSHGDLSTETVVVRQPDACPLEAMRMGACGCVTRPPRAEEVDVVLARAAEKAHLRRENHSLRIRLRRQEAAEPLVTRDPSMRRLVSTLEQAAAADVPVLVRGEEGTGRRLVARTLHHSSSRSAGPFVAVDCRLVSCGQLEDELFGHEKGAFAGAHFRKPGLLELAQGGLVFLSEIERTTPAVQAKLLRAIEARELVRVGGIQPAACDVRIVAATRSDLRARAREGSFREDLSYRLSTVTLDLPPLRERVADIPLLALHFLDRLFGHEKRTISAEALRALRAYPWPGNVDELRMVVERAAMLGAGEVLEAGDLPLEVREPGCAALRPGLTLEEMEREYILAMLRRNAGHRGRTARELGIDPKTLYNKLGPQKPRGRRNIAEV